MALDPILRSSFFSCTHTILELHRSSSRLVGHQRAWSPPPKYRTDDVASCCPRQLEAAQIYSATTAIACPVRFGRSSWIHCIHPMITPPPAKGYRNVPFLRPLAVVRSIPDRIRAKQVQSLHLSFYGSPKSTDRSHIWDPCWSESMPRPTLRFLMIALYPTKAWHGGTPGFHSWIVYLRTIQYPVLWWDTGTRTSTWTLVFYDRSDETWPLALAIRLRRKIQFVSFHPLTSEKLPPKTKTFSFRCHFDVDDCSVAAWRLDKWDVRWDEWEA